jgi:hypothetical protein
MDCRLWASLADRPPAKTLALITDVGNDILYGAAVEDILGWVSTCMGRLRAMGAETVLTDLPLASIASLSAARFLLFRSVLVPSCRLSLHDVADRSAAVAEGLAALAVEQGARFFKLKGEWYGFDPIHIRPRLWQSAWCEILLGDVAPPSDTPRSLRQSLRLYVARPERQRFLGIEQRRTQPAVTIGRATTVWLY